MLAQNLMTPAQLGISNAEFDALLKVLGMLERGELKHVDEWARQASIGAFNMDLWQASRGCGTIACIGGWAEIVGDLRFVSEPDGVLELFFPDRNKREENCDYNRITPAQAAIALRNYLTTGEPRWAEALAE